MISRKAQFESQCKGKIKRYSQGKADAHARHLTRKNHRTYHSYFCVFCREKLRKDVWHVGKEKE